MKKGIYVLGLKAIKHGTTATRPGFNLRTLPICASHGGLDRRTPSMSQNNTQMASTWTPLLLNGFDSSCSSRASVRGFHAPSAFALYHPLRQAEASVCCLPKTFQEQVCMNQLRESHRWSKKRLQNDQMNKRYKSSPSEQEGKGEESLTLYQRFKRTYKEHGKVLVAVHLVTSAVWFGSFYAFVAGGIDIVPLLEEWNCPESILSKLRTGGLGNIAVAYLLYKIATPARYTVTIGGTNLAIKHLRQAGKIPHMREEDKLRSLYKEGKANLKHRKDLRMTRFKKNKFAQSYRKMRTRLRSRRKH